MFSQKPHQIVSLATLYRMTRVVEGPKHPLHRDPFQRFAQDLRDLLANRQQDSIQEQRRRDLPLYRIGRACPQVGSIQHAFGHSKGLLSVPLRRPLYTQVMRRLLR